MNVKLCKYLLGVHKSCTNDAVRGELGRFPILINILNHANRFYERILSQDGTLVKFSSTDTAVKSCDTSWVSAIEKIRQLFGSFSMKASMEAAYSRNWSTFIKSLDCDNKLRAFSKFKSTFCLENYIIKFPLQMRRNFTKLRLSAHSLAIETGRYSKPKTEIDKRICLYCKVVEDEYHFLFNCNIYSTERSVFVNDLSTFSHVPFFPSDDNFTLLMSYLNGDIEAGSAICAYTNACFEKKNTIYDRELWFL